MQNQQPQINDNDEIDLIELFHALWREKLLIIAIAVVTVLLSVVYAFTATPQYQTSSILTPAKTKDLDALNSSSIFSLSPSEALERVGASLESWDVRFAFFQQNKELFADLMNDSLTDEQNFLQINEKFNLARPEEKHRGFLSFVRIALDYPKGVPGPDIVNGLVDYAVNAEKERIKADLDASINSRLRLIENDLIVLFSGYSTSKRSAIAKLEEESRLRQLELQDELKALQQSLRTIRENRIKTLDEAIVVAKTLGITKPTSPSNLSSERSTSSNVVRTEIINQQQPLYFMGSEALEAEKAMLEARADDDFTSDRIVDIQQELKLLENNRKIEVLNDREDENLFLSEIAEKQQEITLLSNINVDYERLQLVQIDKRALQPVRSIKPNKPLIVALGLIVGGVFGVFIALLRTALRNRQQKQLN